MILRIYYNIKFICKNIQSQMRLFRIGKFKIQTKKEIKKEIKLIQLQKKELKIKPQFIKPTTTFSFIVTA